MLSVSEVCLKLHFVIFRWYCSMSPSLERVILQVLQVSRYHPSIGSLPSSV